MMKNLRNIFIWACLLHNIVLEHSAIFSCGQRGGGCTCPELLVFYAFPYRGEGVMSSSMRLYLNETPFSVL